MLLRDGAEGSGAEEFGAVVTSLTSSRADDFEVLTDPSVSPLTVGRSSRSATVPLVPSPAAAASPEAVAETVVQAIGGSTTSITPRHRARRLVMLLSDAVALTLSMMIGLLVISPLDDSIEGIHRVVRDLKFVPVFLLAVCIHGGYSLTSQRLATKGGQARRAMARALSTGVLLSLAFDALLSMNDDRHLRIGEALAIGAPALLLLPALRHLVRRIPGLGRAQATRVMIVGSGRVATSVAARLGRCEEVEVVGMVDDDPPPGQPVLGGLGDLPRLIQQHRVDHALVAFSRTPSHQTLDQLRQSGSQVSISVVPRLYEMLTWRSRLEELQGIPLLHVAPAELSRAARRIKRGMDIVVSSAALFVLSPVMLVAAIGIRMTSPGPVFFRQLRSGRGGVPFSIFKFRTMYVDAEDRRADLLADNEIDSVLFKIRDDPRITKVGKFLRKTSIDELPQFINVLKGDMSLVGPRPFILEESAQIEGWATRRFDVPPGITGLWQVSGRSELTYDDLRHLDTVYVTSWSLWWDLRILAQTPGSVLKQRGAF
jgi:exopolysaccharide biosynthesis polyprenyl glycosylphosphotransferase